MARTVKHLYNKSSNYVRTGISAAALATFWATPAFAQATGEALPEEAQTISSGQQEAQEVAGAEPGPQEGPIAGPQVPPGPQAPQSTILTVTESDRITV